MVSSTKWPVSDYEFEIAESLNMTHRGARVTYNDFVSGTINGTLSAKLKSVRKIINQNFIKVCFSMDFNPIWLKRFGT